MLNELAPSLIFIGLGDDYELNLKIELLNKN